MTKLHPLEADVKKAINELLDEYGWFHFAPPTSQYGINGISDIIAMKAGRFMAIEVKLKKTTGTPLQEEFLESVRKQGGIGLVVNMDKLPKFRMLLHQMAQVQQEG